MFLATVIIYPSASDYWDCSQKGQNRQGTEEEQQYYFVSLRMRADNTRFKESVSVVNCVKGGL